MISDLISKTNIWSHFVLLAGEYSYLFYNHKCQKWLFKKTNSLLTHLLGQPANSNIIPHNDSNTRMGISPFWFEPSDTNPDGKHTASFQIIKYIHWPLYNLLRLISSLVSQFQSILSPFLQQTFSIPLPKIDFSLFQDQSQAFEGSFSKNHPTFYMEKVNPNLKLAFICLISQNEVVFLWLFLLQIMISWIQMI